MRKMSLYALLLCLALGTAAMAAAKETTRTVKGSVTTVDTSGRSFAVKEKSTDETFWVADATKIEEHGKTITLADLKSGEEVMVWYTSNAGKNEATKVIVQNVKETKSSKSGSRP
jgi:hypothetical protein